MIRKLFFLKRGWIEWSFFVVSQSFVVGRLIDVGMENILIVERKMWWARLRSEYQRGDLGRDFPWNFWEIQEGWDDWKVRRKLQVFQDTKNTKISVHNASLLRINCPLWIENLSKNWSWSSIESLKLFWTRIWPSILTSKLN